MPEDINAAVDESQLRTLDADAEKRMIEKIDETAAGNTLGGICEVVADGIPVGLGSHVSWTASSMGASARRSCPSRR
jgi:chorismate synthase